MEIGASDVGVKSVVIVLKPFQIGLTCFQLIESRFIHFMWIKIKLTTQQNDDLLIDLRSFFQNKTSVG